MKNARSLLEKQSKVTQNLTRNFSNDWLESLEEAETKGALEQLVHNEQLKAEKIIKDEVEIALSEKEKSDSKHQHGIRRAGKIIQSALTKFSAFLDSYSCVVEVVKQADQQYGGLAYSILSVFLIVSTEFFKPIIRINGVAGSR